MNEREIALDILNQAKKRRKFITDILEDTFSRYRLTEQDRRFIQEITYGVTKFKKRLDYIIDELSERRKVRPLLRNVLRIGVYQILFMDGVPDYAAVNESVKLVKAKDAKLVGYVNALLRRAVREGRRVLFPDPAKDPVNHLSTFYSHPEWLIQRWLKRYGYGETQKLCEVNNTTPRLCIRTNTLRISPQELVAKLKEEDVEVNPGRYIDYVFYLNSSIPVSKLSTFKEGLFQIQDESAVLIGELFNPKPGEKIVDLCASPGGKSTHLAQLIEDNGIILAVDVSLRRLKPLVQNLMRLGVQSVYPVVSDGKYFQVKRCDGVLLDVPCSGSGTLQRKADLRWRMNEDEIKILTKIQLRLLENAASLLRVGGKLVYSTCSIEPDENEDVVHQFLSDHPDFCLQAIAGNFPKELVRDKYYLSSIPHRHGIDGVFGCVLRKS